MASLSAEADMVGSMDLQLETETFESPSDLKSWLAVERKLVCLASKRRLKEASDLVEAYAAGDLTQEQAKEKFKVYALHWPTRLCLDESIESEIESEATGFEPNPTGDTPYRPRLRQRSRSSPSHPRH